VFDPSSYHRHILGVYLDCSLLPAHLSHQEDILFKVLDSSSSLGQIRCKYNTIPQAREAKIINVFDCGPYKHDGDEDGVGCWISRPYPIKCLCTLLSTWAITYVYVVSVRKLIVPPANWLYKLYPETPLKSYLLVVECTFAWAFTHTHTHIHTHACTHTHARTHYLHTHTHMRARTHALMRAHYLEEHQCPPSIQEVCGLRRYRTKTSIKESVDVWTDTSLVVFILMVFHNDRFFEIAGHWFF
jgi:hypothetical protein